MRKFNDELRRTNRKIILFHDNFSGHTDLPDCSHIRFELFEPNLTPFVQPCDQGVIRAWKSHFKRE
jgi:hypothetical protein